MAEKVELESIKFGRVLGERPVGMMYANETEKFWKRSYVVGFDNHTNSGILVNADYEGDAIDAAADFAEEMGWEGYFLDEKDIEDDDEDVERVGNHGRPINSDELWLVQVRNDEVPGPR